MRVKEPWARVHSTVLADVELQVMALRALHAKLRDLDSGENFGGVVARSRPTGRRFEGGESSRQTLGRRAPPFTAHSMREIRRPGLPRRPGPRATPRRAGVRAHGS
jgi:hypothetical protein